uniref:Odorant-binding protein n=1 Tax=Anoplophora chinensis TaxID=217632 RepID=A0A2H4ZB55_ANOCN|nr:odorant-binding protein [Anoplophora chinensis]
MITYVLFFFVFTSAVLNVHCGILEKNITLAAHCMEEAKVTQEVVDTYMEDPEKEPTEDFYCYLQCVFTGVGLIDENGDLDIDLYKSMFVVDVDCLKDMPKIVKCTDMEALSECVKD